MSFSLSRSRPRYWGRMILRHLFDAHHPKPRPHLFFPRPPRDSQTEKPVA